MKENKSDLHPDWSYFWTIIKDESIDENLRPFLDYCMENGWPAPLVRWVLVAPNGKEFDQTTHTFSGYRGGGTRFQQRIAADKCKRDLISSVNTSYLTPSSQPIDSGEIASNRYLERQRLELLQSNEYQLLTQLKVVCRLDFPTSKEITQ